MKKLILTLILISSSAYAQYGDGGYSESISQNQAEQAQYQQMQRNAQDMYQQQQMQEQQRQMQDQMRQQQMQIDNAQRPGNPYGFDYTH